VKIIICYPPFSEIKGTPLLSQNRQYQVFSERTVIYPIVPAQAATLLKQAGHEVIWLDCIAEGIPYDSFIEIIRREKPDLIAFETKTPVLKQHWKIIDEIKKGLSPQGTVPQIVLFGDHVTALPEESFQNSQVDFVLTGGDYDFLLLNLCKSLTPNTYDLRPNLLEPGIYYRDNGQINPSTALKADGERSRTINPSTTLCFDRLSIRPERVKRVEGLKADGEQSRTIRSTGQFQLNHDLNALPFIDRDLTKWQLYAYENGNYKRTPGTYIMSGRDCWHREGGGCTFCAWSLLYPKFRVRKVENVLDEVGQLIEKYKIREVMDDTGTFPAGDWLREFCKGMIERGYNKKIFLDCNMRFGALYYEDFALMKKANFRLLLFGLESANQKTLDRINKRVAVERIIQDCKLATKARLYPHITIMFGYPWESYAEALNTLKLGRWLLQKGYAYTMQATVVIPYPGTPLFAECKQKGWLKTLDWDDYDMKQPVMETSVPDEEIMKLVQGMYKVSFQPEFMLRKLFSLRDVDDLKYALRAAEKVIGHIFDFKKAKAQK